MAQYQTEIDLFIEELTEQLAKSLPDMDKSFNDFKSIILNFTTVDELDAYLVAVTNMGVSLPNAIICAKVFFQGRWASVLALANQ